MVYTAESRSLALLEMLVQDDPLRAHCVLIPAYLPLGVSLEFMEAGALPQGWRKEATKHHMWSVLRDERGRPRANIFYKAAFYDRSAHISLCQCITVTRRFYDESHETDTAVLTADDRVLFATERVGDRDYPAVDASEKTARAWADEHYPDWRDPLAYWDSV